MVEVKRNSLLRSICFVVHFYFFTFAFIPSLLCLVIIKQKSLVCRRLRHSLLNLRR